MSSEIHWIKITTDMFEDEKIRLIEKMPDGDTILVIWIKLLTLAGRVNAGGYILLTENIPYTDEMLSTLFSRPIMTVQLALQVFEKFDMLHLDGVSLVLTNWGKHQNAEALDRIREQTRLRVAKHRGKDGNVTQPLQVTQGNATEVEIEVDTKIKNKTKEKLLYGQFSNVLLTENEYTKLRERFSEIDADAKIENLSIGIESKGYKYKSHYATILNWSRRDDDTGIAPDIPVPAPDRAMNADITDNLDAINAIWRKDDILDDEAKYLSGFQLNVAGGEGRNLYRVFQSLRGTAAAAAPVKELWTKELTKLGVEV